MHTRIFKIHSIQKPRLETWNAHKHCIVCSQANHQGLGLCFYKNSSSQVEAIWTAIEEFQGYTGLLQGGITAALLDSAMVNSLRLLEVQAVTAEMNVRYLHPIPIGSCLTIRGEVTKSRKNLHWTQAEIYCEKLLVAHAHGKFIEKHADHL